jgi:hypothetical protein
MKITGLAAPARIREGGAYAMSAADYFKDPCPDASLTQSLAKILCHQSPRHAWHAHPRLNPDYEPDESTQFDIGNVAHMLLIGRGKEFEVITARDWRTKDAQALRAVAQGLGKVAILEHQYQTVEKMVDVLRDYLSHMPHCENAFTGSGEGEVVLAAEVDDIWLRTMVDYIEPGGLFIDDYKTFSASVAPWDIGRIMDQQGWDMQAAMYELLLDQVDPDTAGRRKYRFFAQETFAPYCVVVQTIPESALTMGRKKLGYARAIFRQCLQTGIWPGYTPDQVSEPAPAYAEQKWLMREINEEERSRQKPKLPDPTMVRFV